MKLNPQALATSGIVELDEREGIQEVTRSMILDYVLSLGELPKESAHPFAAWLDEAWNDFNEDGTCTNGEVISGALSHWRGHK